MLRIFSNVPEGRNETNTLRGISRVSTVSGRLQFPFPLEIEIEIEKLFDNFDNIETYY